MTYEAELDRERAYTARVQQLLASVIAMNRENAVFQDDTIRMILADTWDELRMKPTALSPWDLDQLNAELSRFVARRSFSADRAAQYEKMLSSPFFARIDFAEDISNFIVTKERRFLKVVPCKGEVSFGAFSALGFCLTETAPLTTVEVALTLIG